MAAAFHYCDMSEKKTDEYEKTRSYNETKVKKVIRDG